MSVPPATVSRMPLELANPLPAALVPQYLARLGIDDPGPVGVAGLVRLHTAHVERVAYENLDLVVGRPAPIAVEASVRRVLAGRGGYCFHLNGAFAALLAALGYRVVPRRAGIHTASMAVSPGVNDTHLALTVHGVPGADGLAGDWLVDVGLGDGLHAPVPLVEGRYDQGPFTYGLRGMAGADAGWRFDHDPTAPFVGMDVGAGVARIADFEPRHRSFSDDADSPFRRVVTVQRRDASGVDLLTGLRRSRRDADGTRSALLDDRTDWFDCLADEFGLDLTDLGSVRADLWRSVCSAHAARYPAEVPVGAR